MGQNPAASQLVTVEVMTAAQAATLKTLAQDAFDLDAFKPKLTHAEADKRIAKTVASSILSIVGDLAK